MDKSLKTIISSNIIGSLTLSFRMIYLKINTPIMNIFIPQVTVEQVKIKKN